MTEITGTLRDARILFTGDPRSPCLVGRVFGDSKGRFYDGESIVTSRLTQQLVGQPAGQVFVTNYSTYKVESWA